MRVWDRELFIEVGHEQALAGLVPTSQKGDQHVRPEYLEYRRPKSGQERESEHAERDNVSRRQPIREESVDRTAIPVAAPEWLPQAEAFERKWAPKKGEVRQYCSVYGIVFGLILAGATFGLAVSTCYVLDGANSIDTAFKRFNGLNFAWQGVVGIWVLIGACSPLLLVLAYRPGHYLRYQFSPLPEDEWELVVSRFMFGLPLGKRTYTMREGARLYANIEYGFIAEAKSTWPHSAGSFSRSVFIHDESGPVGQQLDVFQQKELRSRLLKLHFALGIPFEDELVTALSLPEVCCGKNYPRRISLRGGDGKMYFVAQPARDPKAAKASAVASLLTKKINPNEGDLASQTLVVVPLENVRDVIISQQESLGECFFRALLCLSVSVTVVGIVFAAYHWSKRRQFSEITFSFTEPTSDVGTAAMTSVVFEDLTTINAVRDMLARFSDITVLE